MKTLLLLYFRLDFDNFVLSQPESTDHVCQNDQFVVSGGPPIPAICGVNTGLHSKCIRFSGKVKTCNKIVLIVLTSFKLFF